VCCSFFATIGALFLFLISGLMKSHYPYVHIEGDLQAMASSTGYAGASRLMASHHQFISCRTPHFFIHHITHTHKHSYFSAAGLVYMLIAMVSMCYWVQGISQRKEWEETEQETNSLLGGGSGGEKGQEEEQH